MGHSQYDTTIQARAAWNAGRKVGTKRPLKQKQFWTIRFFLPALSMSGAMQLVSGKLNRAHIRCDGLETRQSSFRRAHRRADVGGQTEWGTIADRVYVLPLNIEIDLPLIESISVFRS